MLRFCLGHPIKEQEEPQQSQSEPSCRRIILALSRPFGRGETHKQNRELAAMSLWQCHETAPPHPKIELLFCDPAIAFFSQSFRFFQETLFSSFPWCCNSLPVIACQFTESSSSSLLSLFPPSTPNALYLLFYTSEKLYFLVVTRNIWIFEPISGLTNSLIL